MSGRPRVVAVHALAVALKDAGLDRATRRFVVESVAAQGRFIGRTPRGGRTRVLPTIHNRWMADAFLDGESSTAIARRAGLTRSHVAAVVKAHGVDAMAVKAERSQRARDARQLAELRRRMQNPRACSICKAWVLRGDAFETCSPECAKLAQGTQRYWNDADRHESHRMQQARTILRRPWKYKPSSVAWAERMMSDDPPPPNRRYVLPRLREQAQQLGVASIGRELPKSDAKPCAATNLDGSLCRRNVTAGEVCHIHAARSEVAS